MPTIAAAISNGTKIPLTAAITIVLAAATMKEINQKGYKRAFVENMLRNTMIHDNSKPLINM